MAAVLLSACTNDTVTDDEPAIPEGMGRIRITICTPEDAPSMTRAVNANPWEDPDHEWERLQTFRILICNTSNQVVQIIEGDKNDMTLVGGSSYPYKQSAEITSQPIPFGIYNIYATANFADGYIVGSTVDLNRTEKFSNGYSTANIPMTGKLSSSVSVVNQRTADAGIITVWRVMAKLQFEFTNESAGKIKIKGIEIDPINADSEGKGLIYLFSKDDLTSTANLAAGTGVHLPSGVNTAAVRYEPAEVLELNATNGTGDLFFYVNETDATYTVTENQYSVRFKIQRQKPDESWYDDELRYGFTTHYGDGTTGQNGFNVIRRNDWIHIPVVLTDWQLRIEPLAFVPIAGYPATLLSNDALTATFSTGGMIALQPFIKKVSDISWRDFDDSEITLVSVDWKNADGTNVSGDGKIVKTAFGYDPITKCIIGELNNNLTGGPYMTTFTMKVKLGSSGSLYDYTFTFNVVLDKSI